MNFLYKGVIATGVVGTGSIGTYYGIKSFNKTIKIRDQLKDRLLDTSGLTNQSQWEARLTSLRGSSVKKENLTPELQEIKDSSKNKTWKDLRDWCAKRVENIYGEEDSKFKEIVDYCTFRNKDKLGDKVITEELESGGGLKNNGKWKTVSEALKGKEGTFSTAIIEIKNKLKAAHNPETTALRTWCESIYETPWINNKDSDFQDAQQYCLDK